MSESVVTTGFAFLFFSNELWFEEARVFYPETLLFIVELLFII